MTCSHVQPVSLPGRVPCSSVQRMAAAIPCRSVQHSWSPSPCSAVQLVRGGPCTSMQQRALTRAGLQVRLPVCPSQESSRILYESLKNRSGLVACWSVQLRAVMQQTLSSPCSAVQPQWVASPCSSVQRRLGAPSVKCRAVLRVGVAACAAFRAVHQNVRDFKT